MTIPTPNAPLSIITPEGRPAYLNPYSGTYTTNRSYAMRMQRGFARGMSQPEARGHSPTAGLTESYWRTLRRKWVDELNYRAWPNPPSPRMNVTSSGRDDPRIFRQDIIDVINLYQGGYRDPAYQGIDTWQGWVEWRLAGRLSAIIEYQDYNDASPGRSAFFSRGNVWFGQFSASAPPPIEFWYYH